MTTSTKLERIPGSRRTPYDERDFPWGKVVKCHTFEALGIGVVEFLRDYSRHHVNEHEKLAAGHGQTQYHLYLLRDGSWRDDCTSFPRLDSAVVAGISQHRAGDSDGRHEFRAFERMTLPWGED